MKLNRILAGLSAAAIAASMLTMVSVSADTTTVDFDTIAYKFSVTEGSGTVTWKIQDKNWAGHDVSVEVEAGKEYTVTMSDIGVDSVYNMGFIDGTAGDIKIDVETVTVNGYEFDGDDLVATDDGLLVNDGTNNCLANIWNDTGKAETVATSTDGKATLVGGGETITLAVEDSENETSDVYAKLTGSWSGSFTEGEMNELSIGSAWDGGWFQIDYGKEGYTADVSNATIVFEVTANEDVTSGSVLLKFADTADTTDWKLVANEDAAAGTKYTYEISFAELLAAEDADGYPILGNTWEGGFGCNYQNGALASTVTAYMTGIEYTEAEDSTEDSTTSGSDSKESSISSKAFLMFADSSWGWGNWLANGVQKLNKNGEVEDVGKGTDAVVTGDGTYTVSISAEQVAKWYDADGNTVDAGTDGATHADASGATVFCVDMVGLADLIGANSSDLDKSATTADKMKLVTDLGVTISGVTITVDGGEYYTIPDELLQYADIEGNGNLRIELYNEYGETKNSEAYAGVREAIQALSATDSIAVTFTITGLDEVTPVIAIETSEKYSEEYSWYSEVTGLYYKTKEDALAASGGDESKVKQGDQSTTESTESTDSTDSTTSTASADSKKSSDSSKAAASDKDNDPNVNTGAAALGTVGVLLAAAAVVATKKKD